MRVGSALPLAALFDAQLVRWGVWVGLVLLTVALLLLIRTRWGQSQPLGKCIVLSLLAHLLLGIYLTTVNMVTGRVGSPDGRGIQVALVADSAAPAIDAQRGTEDPWNGVPGPGPAQGLGAGSGLGAEAPQAPPVTEVPLSVEPERRAEPLKMPLKPIEPPALSADEAAAIPDAPVAPETRKQTSDAGDVSPADVDPVPPPEPAPPDAEPVERREQVPTEAAAPASGSPGGSKLAGSPKIAGSSKAMPDSLRLRVGDHSQVAKGFGATPQSEAAVKAALAWLAANQSAGGRWDARRLGAGGARARDGQDRYGAGSTADTGITGLALLSFLAAGHTHVQGDHQTTVRRGLEFLMTMQDGEGNVGASTNMYEKMYCHAMATCALSEAYAMSRDERLAPAVRQAIRFSLATQDRASGGWRYAAGQEGDTSQLGWQVMALKSAQLAGLDMPDATRAGIERFLKTVAGGRDRGLAYYQPNRKIPSRSMTAEALVCRQFLEIPDTPAALAEASEELLREVPGAGVTNHYYWYYGTLSLYQLQGEAWQRWNESLQRSLLNAQRTDGAMSGSWDPDPIWGGCGGRVYSTALATLCLEVYYRFLPLYAGAAQRQTRVK
jgi:hypothetical protein